LGTEDNENEEAVADPNAEVVVPPMARPVPLVVEVERDGKTWLVRSEGRSIALVLDSLRELRGIPGTSALRLQVTLPPPPAYKKRFRGQG